MENIEIIENNAGGITVQDTKTHQVAYLGHKSTSNCVDSLKALLESHSLDGWDLSDPECYISDEEYGKHESSGGYRLLDIIDISNIIVGR